MKQIAPRLIHCVLPSYAADQSTIFVRVIATEKSVTVLSHAPLASNKPSHLAIDTGIYGKSWVSDAPLPEILKNVFERRQNLKKPSNENRLSVTNEVEFSVIWSGNTARAVVDPLHEFLSHYALRASRVMKTKDDKIQTAYLLMPHQVVGFQRIVSRLRARRPWMDMKLTGPWPPFSFPEIWPEKEKSNSIDNSAAF
jgi:hypothetical protein